MRPIALLIALLLLLTGCHRLTGKPMRLRPHYPTGKTLEIETRLRTITTIAKGRSDLLQTFLFRRRILLGGVPGKNKLRWTSRLSHIVASLRTPGGLYRWDSRKKSEPHRIFKPLTALPGVEYTAEIDAKRRIRISDLKLDNPVSRTLDHKQLSRLRKLLTATLARALLEEFLPWPGIPVRVGQRWKRVSALNRLSAIGLLRARLTWTLKRADSKSALLKMRGTLNSPPVFRTRLFKSVSDVSIRGELLFDRTLQLPRKMTLNVSLEIEGRREMTINSRLTTHIRLVQ